MRTATNIDCDLYKVCIPESRRLAQMKRQLHDSITAEVRLGHKRSRVDYGIYLPSHLHGSDEVHITLQNSNLCSSYMQQRTFTILIHNLIQQKMQLLLRKSET